MPWRNAFQQRHSVDFFGGQLDFDDRVFRIVEKRKRAISVAPDDGQRIGLRAKSVDIPTKYFGVATTHT
eukprot:scaffold333_cov133-Cylindrotheca_fusiformis.AAC.44